MCSSVARVGEFRAAKVSYGVSWSLSVAPSKSFDLSSSGYSTFIFSVLVSLSYIQCVDYSIHPSLVPFSSFFIFFAQILVNLSRV